MGPGMSRLAERFGNELAFNRYLQGSTPFRRVVEQGIGLKLRKTSATTLKEVRLYRRPRPLVFPAELPSAWWLDPVIMEANKDFIRADLVLFNEDFSEQILVESQFGLSDLDHRKRLMEYYNSTRLQISPERDDWAWVFWVAEDFRSQDVEWAREQGHPIAMFRAWPKGNTAGFELVYAPSRIDTEAISHIEPHIKRPPEEW